MDKLLHQIQMGVNDTLGLSPVVHCLYLRLSDQGRQFRIAKDTLAFDRTTLRAFPASSRIQSGTPEEQVIAFARSVELPESGPVHLIVGAHGNASEGLDFSPLREFIRGILGLFDFLKTKKNRTIEHGVLTSPNRTSSTTGLLSLGGTEPALGLDRLAAALRQLRRTSTSETPVKLNSILLHACHMSSIECIKSLEYSDLQIAIENEISDTIGLQQVFRLLADTGATPEKIANEYVAQSPPRVYISAHRSETQSLIAALNALARHLSDSIPGDELRNAILNSRRKSRLGRGDSFDVVRFCQLLAEELPLCRHECEAVINSLSDIQIGKQQKPEIGAGHSGYGCVSIYIPATLSPQHPPESFTRSAAEWWTLVSTWYSDS